MTSENEQPNSYTSAELSACFSIKKLQRKFKIYKPRYGVKPSPLLSGPEKGNLPHRNVRQPTQPSLQAHIRHKQLFEKCQQSKIVIPSWPSH